jgi:hypothetical protein
MQIKWRTADRINCTTADSGERGRRQWVQARASGWLVLLTLPWSDFQGGIVFI